MQELLLCESKEAFEDMVCVKEKKWSESFVDYFQSKLLVRIDAYGLWSIKKYVETDKLLTTNQSEGFNTLIKSLQNFKECSLDLVLLSLQLLQKYYQNEIT